MSDTVHCRRCGAELAFERQSCSRCLFELALREAAPGEAPEPSSPSSGLRITLPSLDEVARALPQFDQFTPLGEGGMGAVFRAHERALDRWVAIKVLPRELGARPDFRERFLREVRALARLSHPNVVSVHGAGEADGLCYLVMELVEGRTLREAMRERPIDAAEALRIVRALCDALQYAHDEGVVHRDVKPENVLLDRAGRVKIADFGLAKLVGRDGQEPAHLTRADQVMGTPHYMAPEQLERPREVDHRADLFAVGVVLYELLTGSLPRGTFELPSRRVSIDVRIDEIVLKALEREPTRRYQHALEVKSDVERVESGPAVGGKVVATGDATAIEARRERRKREARGGHGQPALDPLRNGRAIPIWAAAWVVCAAAWNLGAFAFGFSLAGLVAAIVALTRLRMRARPDLAAAIGERSAWRSQPAAALLIFVALALVALAHVNHWERGTALWNPSYSGTFAQLDAANVDPFALARASGVDPSAVGELTVQVASSSTQTTGGELPGVNPWTLFAAAAVLLLLGIRSLVDVRRSPELRPSAWSLSTEVASEIAGVLVLWWVLAPAIALREKRVLGEVVHSFSIAADAPEVTRRLHAALAKQALSVDVDQAALLVERRSAAPLAELRFCRAAAESPFERWNTSWAGPIRETPRIWARVGQPVAGGASQVQLRAGLYVSGSAESASAKSALEQIEAELHGS